VADDVPGWEYARPRAAYAVVRGDVPDVFIAESEAVLNRVLALHLVAATSPERLGPFLNAVRAALLEERWGDAVFDWMEATGNVVDAYPDETVWRDADLEEERFELELRVAPIFRGFAPEEEP
jgi:hypothetical protein